MERRMEWSRQALHLHPSLHYRRMGAREVVTLSGGGWSVHDVDWRMGAQQMLT